MSSKHTDHVMGRASKQASTAHILRSCKRNREGGERAVLEQTAHCVIIQEGE